jgi:predicted RNA binding protein YcfA (HicA-like mRNA interferase family)
MTKLPLVDAATLIKILQREDFLVTRQRGSHMRLKHPDGRVTTIPIHAGSQIQRGLLRKILRDLDWSIEDFITLLQ